MMFALGVMVRRTTTTTTTTTTIIPFHPDNAHKPEKLSTKIINMAFVSATPLTAHRSLQLRSVSSKQQWRMTSTRPQPPKDFTTPKPRRFYIRPDKALDIASSSFGQLLRAYSGALVEGYRFKTEDGKIVEYSTTLPNAKPTIPLRFFEFEACPFCKKVREAVTMLDLDVLYFPCPKGGTTYRPYVMEKGGKAQFPYLEDPNTSFEGYESDDIIKYLYKTYGPSSGRVPSIIGSSSIYSAAVASRLRAGKGRDRAKKVVPAAEPIELWGYEASPFVRLVREALSELEIPYYLHTTARGSVKRKQLTELTGSFQVPYIVDPNTGISMFESAEICEYLRATYGPNAEGAVEKPDVKDVFMPGMTMGVAGTMEEEKVEKSLDPQPVKDEVLEEYCADNPDSDECRVYED